MRRAVIVVKKFAILCHRWMGVAFCILFAWWFLSGIFMMYWDYPSVSQANRLERAEAIDGSRIQLSPQEAWAKLGQDGSPTGVTLATFDGRPVYRFTAGGGGGEGRGGGRRGRGGGGGTMVYADDGTTQTKYSDELALRLASTFVAQPPSSAVLEEVTEADQWTIGVRNRLPLTKYSYPDGQQVYMSNGTGEILQHTTTSSRIFAHLGAIPHWLYYTPLRVQQKLWTNVVTYASGIGTIMALLGMIVGIWMYSPAKKYRLAGEPTSVPYTGQKRLHMILGLFFGIVTCTWAFSGMLSMDPPFLSDQRAPGPQQGGRGGGGGQSLTGKVQAALRPGRFDLSAYEMKPMRDVLKQLDLRQAKEIQFTAFDGQPVYVAALGPRENKIVPVHGDPKDSFDADRIFAMVTKAAGPDGVREKVLLTKYDSYYLDRHGDRPLPVLRVKLNDAEHSQLYIDPRSARVVAQHSDNSSFMTRWLYHGLHSLDFPWLYNYRPAWDIVVLILMLGGLSLCVTSVIIGWQVLQRKFARRRAGAIARESEAPAMGD